MIRIVPITRPPAAATSAAQRPNVVPVFRTSSTIMTPCPYYRAA